MKTLTLLALLISITATAQVSTEVGLTSRLQGVFKVAYEKQTGWNNTELSVRFSSDNIHPAISLQTGFSTQNEFQQANIRFLIGGFYHTGILLPGKEVRCKKLLFGGSVRYELNHGLVSMEYTGETVNLTLGFIFKSRYK